jgi:hypothetical protein
MHSSHVNFRYSSLSLFHKSPRRRPMKTWTPCFRTFIASRKVRRLHCLDNLQKVDAYDDCPSSVTATLKELTRYSFTAAVSRSKYTIPHLPPHRPYKNEFVEAASGYRTFSHHQPASTTTQQLQRRLPLIRHRHWST